MLFSNNSEAQAIKYMTRLCLWFMKINIFSLALQVAIVWLTIDLFYGSHIDMKSQVNIGLID